MMLAPHIGFCVWKLPSPSLEGIASLTIEETKCELHVSQNVSLISEVTLPLPLSDPKHHKSGKKQMWRVRAWVWVKELSTLSVTVIISGPHLQRTLVLMSRSDNCIESCQSGWHRSHHLDKDWSHCIHQCLLIRNKKGVNKITVPVVFIPSGSLACVQKASRGLEKCYPCVPSTLLRLQVILCRQWW